MNILKKARKAVKSTLSNAGHAARVSTGVALVKGARSGGIKGALNQQAVEVFGGVRDTLAVSGGITDTKNVLKGVGLGEGTTEKVAMVGGSAVGSIFGKIPGTAAGAVIGVVHGAAFSKNDRDWKRGGRGALQGAAAGFVAGTARDLVKASSLADGSAPVADVEGPVPPTLGDRIGEYAGTVKTGLERFNTGARLVRTARAALKSPDAATVEAAPVEAAPEAVASSGSFLKIATGLGLAAVAALAG